MTDSDTLKQLWKTIFEQERITNRIIEISSVTDGISFSLETFGTVQLLVKPATAIGDNFMSDTFYITAVLSNGVEHKAFVKVLPGNPLMRATASQLNVYTREIGSYCHLFPLLRQIRDQAGLTNEDLPLDVPEIYYTNLDEKKGNDEENSTVVVMEELSSQGFGMVDKLVGSSMEEAEVVLTALANFHALSFMLLRQYKNDDGSYSLPPSIDFIIPDSSTADMFVTFLSAYVPVVSKMLKHFGHEKASDWLIEQINRLPETFNIKFGPELGPFAVIGHGDLWNNNILFRHDQATGKIKDVRLVDWQITATKTPGHDLQHFLKTSVTLKGDSQQLVDHYAATFLSALQKLGLPLEEEGIDHQSIRAELISKELYGMFMAIGYLPTMLEKKMTENIVEVSKDEAVVASFSENPGAELETFELKLDVVLGNQVLCDRLIYVVENVKKILESL